MPTATDTVRFHFDLSHLDSDPSDLRLHVGVEPYRMSRHDTATLAHAKAINRVVARMNDCTRLSHYADVPASALSDRRLTRLKVTYDHGDPDVPLRGLALIGTYHPPAVLRRVRAAKLAQLHGPLIDAKLLDLGLGAVSLADAPALLVDSDTIVTPMDSAVMTVANHPQLGSTFPPSAASIQENHIKSVANTNAMTNYANTIRQEKTAWCAHEPVTDPTGTPMTYEFSIAGSNVNVGDPVYQYNLSDTVLYGPAGTTNGLAGAIPGAIQSANQDPQLRNQCWTVAQGTPSSPPVAAPAGLEDTSGPTWTVTNKTGNWGVSLDSSSIDLSGSTFTITVTNSYPRTLGAYVTFLGENGDAIDMDTLSTPWSSNLTSGLEGAETPYLKYLQPIQPETIVMGIPIESSSATLTVPWPADANATSFKLYFGSLGGSSYQNPQCVIGGILTGIFNFGFPALFLVQGVTGGSTFLTNLMSGQGTALVVAGVAVDVIGGLTGFTNAVGDSDQLVKMFAGIVAGLLVKAALQSIFGRLLAYMTGIEIADAVPFVGWALRALAVAGYEMQLTETAVQVFSAPAVLEYQVTGTVPISAVIDPDPKHGLPGHPSTAVWPALASTYTATLQYQGGTSTSVAGTMPSPETGTPVTLDFGLMPAGGQFQIVFSVLAANGWLCGSWTSSWQRAWPPSGQSSLVLDGTITENLAPLTADTTYVYAQSIVYDASQSAHVWADAPPTATVTSLDPDAGPGVQAIGSLLDISMLDVTYDVGYAWSGTPLNPPLAGTNAPAPGQAFTFQSVSVLRQPQSRLMTPSNVTAGPSAVAYQKYGPAPTSAGVAPPYNFYIDISTGTPTLRLMDLSNPPGVVPVGTTGLAWATFPQLTSVDQLAVHQTGVAIGLNKAKSRLAIVTLPSAGFPSDSAAPQAQVCAGLGTRQGLLDTPVALDIGPDGTIFVLEQGNQRVQAFDHFGNPVAAFDGAELFSIPAGDLGTTLDGGTVPPGLEEAFESNGVNLLFSIPSGTSVVLAPGAVDPSVIAAFADANTSLSTAATVTASPTGSSDWLVSDPSCSQSYVISPGTGGNAYDVFASLLAAAVTTLSAGEHWIVANRATATSYDVMLSESSLTVYEYLSTFTLVPPASGTPAYLDLAVDPTGYVYVLSYPGASPVVASDYALQIYTANGLLLAQTPNPALPSTGPAFVGAALTIDVWRNVFTLDYELTAGPVASGASVGQAEPTISLWAPTPPVALLDPDTYLTAFTSDPPDYALIKSGLGRAGTSLGSTFTVTQVSPAGHWTIAGPPDFDVILSAGGSSGPLSLYVYAAG